VTEGFFGPLFFVWLGAGLQLRDVAHHPSMILLGLCLGAGATLAHLAPVALRQPTPYALLATAQLGVPVAATTIGTQLGLLRPGEGAALILGALVALVVTVVGGSRAARTTPEPAAAKGVGRAG
jgi:Kef-type K+ transport system membrane component KefB